MSSSSGHLTLGVHVGHDASAAVFADSRLRYAEEEERHTGQKGQGGCPWNAIAAGLTAACAGADEVRTVALTWSLGRYLECRGELAEHARRVGNQPWFEKRQREMATVRQAVEELGRRFPNATVVDFPHHHAHLACAIFLTPPSSRAPDQGPVLGVVADALGDAESVTAFSAPSASALLGSPEVVLQRSPRQSIGFFYKRASEAFGFSGSEACGYLMALSGCGNGEQAAGLIRGRLFERDNGGLLSFRAEAFDPFRGHSESAARCFPQELLTQLGLDQPPGDLLMRATQANAFQRITEEYLEELLAHLASSHRPRTIFLSGGVFLNCVALEKLARALPEVELVVCPVKSDSGTAIGAAVLAEVARSGGQVLEDRHPTLRLGACITGDEADWSQPPGRYEPFSTRQELVAHLADDLAAGELVALVDGPGELGRRALGARSILAQPGSPALAEHLNRQVKSRFPFQPFAGAFLEEDFRPLHPGQQADEFMSFAVRFGAESRESLGGILHRDGTSRAQLVTASEGSILRAVLIELGWRGAASAVLNTSLNARGEPMPRTAADARRVCAQLGLERIYTPKGRWLLKPEEGHAPARRGRGGSR